MKINVWIYLNRETHPGRVHSMNEDGTGVAVIEILDLEGRVELKRVDIQHLDPAVGWSPEGEWIGARGILFIYEDEFTESNPHDVFREYETLRATPPGSEEEEILPDEGEGTPVAAQASNKQHLPPDFPYQPLLAADGITTFGKLRKVIADGALQSVPGIGEARAQEIEAALG